MPPPLALFLCLGFIAWLFWRDSKQRQFASRALWIPLLWLIVIGSRPVSYWFGGGNSAQVLEGNPINSLVLGVLIGSAIVILQRRAFNWGAFIRNNKALCLVYLFFAISAAWSPLGIIALKRLCKDFGTVLVALVLLTETDPFAATRTVFVRVSYLLFPLSVLVIKYYPAIGRNYSIQGGAMATGLTMQKNSLGEVVVVFGLMLVWDLLAMRNENADRRWKTGILIGFGMLAMGGWLLLTCDSVTSIMCFLLGLFILWGGGRLVRMQNGRKVIICWLFALACLIGLNKTFGISDVIIHAFGRNTDLTYRTYIWQAVWAQETDPLIGCGFYSFWDTQFGQNVNAALRVEGLRETHNGYLETFVDGGAVGEGLLIILLMTIGTRSIRRLFDGTFFGRMSLAFWAIAILSSVSEANFLRLGPIWFAFLLLTTECPRFMPAFEENDGPARVEGAVSQNA